MSLIPFVTTRIGKRGDAVASVAVYGAILFMTAAVYQLFATMLARCGRRESELAPAIGEDHKGKLSLPLYAAAIVIHPSGRMRGSPASSRSPCSGSFWTVRWSTSSMSGRATRNGFSPSRARRLGSERMKCAGDRADEDERAGHGE